jgi:hypothetical protein
MRGLRFSTCRTRDVIAIDTNVAVAPLRLPAVAAMYRGTPPALSTRMKTTLAALAALAALAVTATGCSTERELSLLGYQAPCTGEGVYACLVQSDDDGAIGYMYEGIYGFAFEWGYEQRVLVEVSNVDNPPADGSSVRYDLIEVLDKTPVEANARFTIDMTATYVTEDADGYHLPDGRVFACSEASICTELDTRLADSSDWFIVDMEHPTDPTDTSTPLNVVAIRDRS